jgi:hypothetical protein
MAVKLRRPLVVAGLTAITLGIYFIYWYWRVNREMRDFGADRGDSELAGLRPWISVLAITVGGWIVIPVLISLLNTAGRVQWLELSTSGMQRTSLAPRVAAVAAVVLSLGGLAREVGAAPALVGLIAFATFAALVQVRLNATWRVSGATSERVADVIPLPLS